jgi:hypothetical protein
MGETLMNRWHLAFVSLFASAATRAWLFLANCMRLLAIAPADTYRPEAHYMRGPGPKWRAKHARSGGS